VLVRLLQFGTVVLAIAVILTSQDKVFGSIVTLIGVVIGAVPMTVIYYAYKLATGDGDFSRHPLMFILFAILPLWGMLAGLIYVNFNA